jgi:hypothetical protein
MGISDRVRFPQAFPTGLVVGDEFSEFSESLLRFLSLFVNMGAYVVHPSGEGGSIETFAKVMAQAREVPEGWPVIINLVPNTEYTEDLVVPQELAETHDFYVMNPFEDYTESEHTINFTGDIILPEIHTWPTRRKMFNLFGIQTQNIEFQTDSGWDCNVRRGQHSNMTVKRRHQAEGSKMWFHDCILDGNFTMEDLDNGTAGSHLYISHCSMINSDNPEAAFKLRGSYTFQIIESYVQWFFSTGGGLFNFNSGAFFTGYVKLTGNSFICWMSGSPLLFRNGINTNIEWEGNNTIQKRSGGASSFDFGAVQKNTGWPDCRLEGILPTNPPNGCRASDDKSDYKDKVWNGTAWG